MQFDSNKMKKFYLLILIILCAACDNKGRKGNVDVYTKEYWSITITYVVTNSDRCDIIARSKIKSVYYNTLRKNLIYRKPSYNIDECEIHILGYNTK